MYKLISSNKMQNKKEFIITKKIAKHGSQAIIVIPRVLETNLKPGTVVQIKINVIDGGENDKNSD
jgi:hypothetical protein